jgi:membrane dipeptidase
MRRSFVLAIILLIASALLVPAPRAEEQVPEDVMKLHRKALVFDAHCDTAMRLVGRRAIDLGTRQEHGHMDLPRIREGGLDAQIFACWPNPRLDRDTYVKQTLQMIDALWEQSALHADELEIALEGKDVKRIVESGKVAGIIGIEGGHAIMADLGILRNYHRLGVRCMTLTWMNTNEWADSSDDSTKWGGLNDLGRQVVAEMDRLGMIIDCSHVSDSTLFDVLEVTENPVLISHSCMRALCDIPRNVSDDELRALKDNGGVICINYFPGFLDKDFNDAVTVIWNEFRARADSMTGAYKGDREKAWDELRPEYMKKMEALDNPTIETLIDHIDHAVEIAGIDHVGLGSDFDGISITPVGLDDVTDLPAITAELERRGYSEGDIEKILGGNLLRLAERVMR